MALTRSSSDKKETVTIEPSQTIHQVKEVVSGKFDIPTDRLRLIYSGRVLKDEDLVSKYNIKDGVTIHVVKGAAPPGTKTSTSTSAAAASASAPSSATAPNISNASPQVPSNIAAGQGTGNLLADLTGARYAGLANLPSASMFGPDGGMGPAPSPEDMLAIMETPGFSENLQHVLQNPQMVDMIINANPQMRQMGPQFRQMLQSEGFRNMLSNPQMLRGMLQMDQMFRGGSQGASFPAPGGTTLASGGTTTTGTTASTGTSTTETTGTGSTGAETAGNASSPGSAANNPFAALFPGGLPPLNPLGFGPGAGGAPTTNSSGNPGSTPNPYWNPALLSSMFGGNAEPQPVDNRPPEERYESQLRQLNELGFVDFDRNVRALRRSGGSVQGAVEAMLDGQV